MKFHIGDFYEKMSNNFNICLYRATVTTPLQEDLHECLGAFGVLTHSVFILTKRVSSKTCSAE